MDVNTNPRFNPTARLEAVDPRISKGFMLRLFDKLLDRWGIQQASALRVGHKFGHDEGYLLGYNNGHKKGLEDGKLIVELQPGPIPIAGEPGVKPPTFFKNWTFQITPELEGEIRADFARLLKDKPSEDQWKMILSKTPTTSVVAGAGSGKSTTMVLRLLVLYHYLGIHLESLTVITFTKESKLDFAGKVRKVFKQWGYDISKEESLDIVRTFHSRILSFTRSIPGLEKAQAFEFLDLKNDEEEKAGSMFQVKLKPEQLSLMNECYQDLYDSDPIFKDLIAELARRAIYLERLDAQSADAKARQDKVAQMEQIDDALCFRLEGLWKSAGRWPIAGVVPTREKITLLGQTFHSNGSIPQLGAYVILGVDKDEPRDLKIEPDRWPYLTLDVADKRILFQAFCSKPVIFLNSYTDAGASVDAIMNLANACPKFRYKITGEISSQYILEAFYSAASFIENLGLDVIPAIKAMELMEDDPDRAFFKALGRYWVALDEKLRVMSPPVLTFNKMFSMFSERGAKNLQVVPDGVLQPMSTLLIDEFQDVGANTISWVRATFAEIERRSLPVQTDGPPAYASLMAVGDDWQSIYGWRGSSPQFFMDFDNHFLAPPSTRVFMQENHRSHQWVIDAAEAIVKRTGGFNNKQGKAANPRVIGNKVPVQMRDLSYIHLCETAQAHYEAGRSILVLYRVGRTKEVVEKNLAGLINQAKKDDREDDLKLLTYHASKGLQADAVFLLGDCEMTTSSPFKNDIFRQAKMGGADPCGFDTSQRSEALRTAYVAITRAVTYCYWYVDRKEGKVRAYEKASRHVDKSLDCWDVVPSPTALTKNVYGKKSVGQRVGSRRFR
ncbi:UvrD-helicase domain-containing protein [Pseudomonas sp. B21-015]|uniref:UvrD-helicase domain-containing protein n=1 Tax=Pseudomonas sp. B21-015 TaxID=2895473 RepID=UPI00215FC2F7|nr:UvrD-helicase domain-containing protein [Pseudomonas sp. B21-015]UVM47707.1 UvrD-helicase domain-containing protein [Pseudomonas sp. B21-015]